ncbi:MAG: hypothetical protein M1827_004972 [Pycnora praestabilis]|nr:MAG: hypothetical protein M1827_004972 [Pycnora praestabilis]
MDQHLWMATTTPGSTTFPSLDTGSTVHEIRSSEDSGYGSFSRSYVTEASHAHSNSDPFELELHKLFPQGFDGHLTLNPILGRSQPRARAKQEERLPDPYEKRNQGDLLEIIQNLSSSGAIDSSLAYAFSVMVNMLRHLSKRIFHPLFKNGIEDSVIEETKNVVEEIIVIYHGFFGALLDKWNTVKEVQLWLPDLERMEDAQELEVAIGIWKQRLWNSEIQAIDRNELRVFKYFRSYYDVEFYQDFIQYHRHRPNHNIWELAAQLHSIYLMVEDVLQLYRRLVSALSALSKSLRSAMDRVAAWPSVGNQDYAFHAWVNRLDSRLFKDRRDTDAEHDKGAKTQRRKQQIMRKREHTV